MNQYKILLIYMLVINLIAVILTVWDKKAAKRGKQRIRERTLLIVSALGGSAAMFVTMRIIRHKTKHPKFMIGIPIIFMLQVLAVAGLIWMRINYGV